MWGHSKSMAKALLVFMNVALRGGGGRERERVYLEEHRRGKTKSGFRGGGLTPL